MFNAIFWSGQQVCEMLNTVGVTDTTISACNGHQQAVGSIAVMWAALLLVFWRLFPRAH
jgi:hypothetical protein